LLANVLAVLSYLVIQWAVYDRFRFNLHTESKRGDGVTPPIISKFGIWTFTTVDYITLIAAATNAFNGALLARPPGVRFPSVAAITRGTMCTR